MDQTISTIIRAGVPTIAVFVGSIRSTTLINRLGAQIDAFIARLDAQIQKQEREMSKHAELNIRRRPKV